MTQLLFGKNEFYFVKRPHIIDTIDLDRDIMESERLRSLERTFLGKMNIKCEQCQGKVMSLHGMEMEGKQVFFCSTSCRSQRLSEIRSDGTQLKVSYAKLCTYCSAIKEVMMKCSACNTVTYYCNQKCQKSDWKNHRIMCRANPK